MTKITKMILSLLLFLLIVPAYTASAAEIDRNGIKNVHLDENGILRWDAYEGADAYFVDITPAGQIRDGENNVAFQVKETYCDLKRKMDVHNEDEPELPFPTGDYDIRVYAGAQNPNNQHSYITIAYSELDEVYHYEYTAPDTEPAILRLSGKGRYETALTVADQLLAESSQAQFDAAVITTGVNYPDALSGSFLAISKSAPILMISQNSSSMVIDYIKENVKAGGIVYVLGGDGVVKQEWLGDLDSSYTVKRLSGKGRYDTNLAILNELSDAVAADPMFLVCTGRNYADSLSCSSLRNPIFLVGNSLSDAQRQYLSSLDKDKVQFTIIGGEKAVSKEIEAELGNYGKVNSRIAGKSRYETSALIASTFFGSTQIKGAMLATGKNFPDGLAGGPLANFLNGPLLLVDEGKTEAAKGFMNTAVTGESFKPIVLGGDGAVTPETAGAVFN